MRPSLALLSIPLLVTAAYAGPKGGGGGGGGNKGGGALSRVSGGIRAASSASPTPSGGNSRPSRSDDYRGEGFYCYDLLYREVECRHRRLALENSAFALHRPLSYQSIGNKPPAKVHFYAGAQKVADSDGAGTIELAVTDDRFRIAGTFTRYFERLDGGGVLQMSMPTLMGGVRIDDMGATSVFLEGGVVHARTSGDPMGNSKITGPIAGMLVEHSLSKELSVLGDVHQMWFDDEIRATSGRLGVRYKYVQASFRVLDFNVGPALYGPEVGVRF